MQPDPLASPGRVQAGDKVRDARQRALRAPLTPPSLRRPPQPSEGHTCGLPTGVETSRPAGARALDRSAW
jgi:hypothetical protein